MTQLATTEIEYRVTDEKSGATFLGPCWSPSGPTLKQAIDYCEHRNEVEDLYDHRTHTYHVEARAVIRTPWEPIQ